MYRGLRARFTSDHSLSVGADVNGEDVVPVEGLVCSILVLGSHRYFASAVEALLASTGVHDDSQGGDHVHSLALARVPQVLLTIGGSITVDVLDLELNTGGVLARSFDLFGHRSLLQVEIAPSWCHTLLASERQKTKIIRQLRGNKRPASAAV